MTSGEPRIPRIARTGPGRRLRGRRAIRGSIRRDEAGAFLVVEAILVAVLVLTAVLFFTSVQRPTGGSESRGVDLGQVATDTLGILQRRTFTAAPANGDPEDWVTSVLGGDAAMAQTVESFVRQVLPAGSKHTLRLSNGIGTIPLLPPASQDPGLPQGARAAEVPLFPHWQAYATKVPTDVGSPGLTPAAGSALARFLDRADIKCVMAPSGKLSTNLWQPAARTGAVVSGSTVVTGLPATSDLEPGMGVQGSNVPAGATIAAIRSSTSITLSATATGTGSPSLGFTATSIPRGALYGVWAGHVSAGCTDATPTYAAVALPGSRKVTDLATTTGQPTITSSTALFTSRDVGRLVAGAGLRAGSTIVSVQSTTQATLNGTATATAAGVAALFMPNPTYPVYGLQLVVWFGA